MNRTFYVIIGLVVSLFFITSGQTQDYRVGEGDVIKISVYDNPDLEKTVRVSGEGAIVMPLIGEVAVDGLSVTEVTQKITDLLADGFLIDPHVSVFVEEFRSKKAVILGEVNKPGLYEISGDISFLEMVSKAQGFTKTAGNEAIIKRKIQPGQQAPQVIRIDLKDFEESGDNAVNVNVEDGDSIYIKKARLYYVSGEVKSPDAYKWENDMTIIKAITYASGFTAKAAPKAVKIIRKIDGEERVLLRAKMDELVLPDDVIVVPESFF